MTAQRLAPALTLTAFALLLSGCTFTSNLTVSPDAVAKTVEDSLEEKVGARPDVDCGEDQVDLVNGTVVECVLTDPDTLLEYDTRVVINEVEGTDYRVDYTVADQARAGSGSKPEGEEPEAEEPETEGIRHTVAADSVGKLAADALFKEAPPYFEIDCGDGDLEVFLGAIFDCSATHPQGDVYDARITVTDVTETTYNIDVVRSATVRG